MIKLIALDLDDTLLDKNKNISYRNLQAIKEVLDKKIKIIIDTKLFFFITNSPCTFIFTSICFY